MILPPGSSGAVFRSSCNGIELKLRFDARVGAWLAIKRPGCERRPIEIPEAEVDATVEQFMAIGEDREKFKAFVTIVLAAEPTEKIGSAINPSEPCGRWPVSEKQLCIDAF